MNQLFKFAQAVDADIEHRRFLEVLTEIRDEYMHERNSWLYPPEHEAIKYARLRDKAQAKFDAITQVLEHFGVTE